MHVYSDGRFDAAGKSFAQSIRSFEKRIQLRPNNSLFLRGYSRFLSIVPDGRFRNPQKALLLAQQAADIAPHSLFALLYLGCAEYRVGDWNAALRHLERSAEIPFSRGDEYPDYGEDCLRQFLLAMTHFRLGNEEGALSCYTNGVASIEKGQSFKDWNPLRAEAEELLGIQR